MIYSLAIGLMMPIAEHCALEMLQGNWLIVAERWTGDGRVVDRILKDQIFVDGRFRVVNKKAFLKTKIDGDYSTLADRIVLRATTKCFRIDFFEGKEIMEGIFRFVGNDLEIVIAMQNENRPKSFDADPKIRTLALKMKRPEKK